VSSEAKKLKTIQSSYDALAEEYANRFFHELDSSTSKALRWIGC